MIKVKALKKQWLFDNHYHKYQLSTVSKTPDILHTAVWKWFANDLLMATYCILWLVFLPFQTLLAVLLSSFILFHTWYRGKQNYLLLISYSTIPVWIFCVRRSYFHHNIMTGEAHLVTREINHNIVLMLLSSLS